MSRNHITYQPTPSQIGDSSFFEEAIDVPPVPSPVPIEVGHGPSYIASPTQPTESRIFGSDEAPQNILPAVEGDKKLKRRPCNRRRSQAISAPSESSAPGQAAKPPKSRKRGRNPKKQPKEQKAAGQQEELDDGDLIKDPRRRRVLERNRIAATKCRHRKRDEALALASREQAMEDQNRYLSTCFDSLTSEIYYLKNQLLRHTDCNCVLIQKYIANEAKKSVDGLLASSSGFHTHGSSLTPDNGSSSGASIADSLNMQSLEADSFPPIWTSPVQQVHRALEARDDMLDMCLEPFQTAAMPPHSMISAQRDPMLPLVACGAGLYADMGSQEHQADEMSWGTHWEFR